VKKMISGAWICAFALTFGAVIFFSACGTVVSPEDSVAGDATGRPTATFDREVRNLVDERYELVSLIFRLTGVRPEYSQRNTAYQLLLSEEFVEFNYHPAVVFARWKSNHVAWDAPFRLAVHLQRADNGFELVENIGSLMSCGRWSQNSAIRFVELLNDFYHDTDFSQFFQTNMDYFMEVSENFTQEIYSFINKEWFGQFGLNPDNLRIILIPSASYFGYAASVWGQSAADLIHYAAVTYAGGSPSDIHYLTIHELIHGFANPLGDLWYEENEEFRMLNDDATGAVGAHEAYTSGLIMAYEHLTRAFTVKYFIENHENVQELRLLTRNIGMGFPHIVHTFDLISEFERENVANVMKNLDIDIVPPIVLQLAYRWTYASEEVLAEIGNVLGTNDFEFGFEFTFSDKLSGVRGWWYPVYFTNPYLPIQDFPLLGVSVNFPTEFGDVVFMIDQGDAYGLEILYGLLIDIGSGAEHGSMHPRARAYAWIYLN